MRYSTLSDAELLAQTQADPEAFGAFYDRFESPILAFFQRALGRADLAADLAGEVFAEALSSASAFDPSLGSARAWLFGIARHELSDVWGRGKVEDRARQRLGMERIALTDDQLDRIEQLADDRSAKALRLLECLPADQRSAIAGRVLEDHEYSELASALSCSESVVRQRVSRGLRALRKQLEQHK